MKSIPFLRALSILLALVFLVTGVMFFTVTPASYDAFSTSYQDFPDPMPMPKGDLKDVVEVLGFIQSFHISPDGGMIAISTSKELILYDLKTLKEIHSLPLSEKVVQVQFSPDGSKLAASGIIMKYVESGTLHVTVWDTDSWKILYEYKSDTDGSIPSGALAWAPDSERLTFSIPERGLSVIDVNAGKTIATLGDFIVPPFDLSWSPDGLRLISTGDLGYGLRRWRVDTDKWVRLFDARSQPAMQVKWSPDGKQIASGHFGGTVCVWNAGNNQCEGFIRAHFISVDGLDWSPDGKQIATASGAIRLWDSVTGEMTSAFGFYDGIIYKELRWFDPQTIATLETGYTQQLPSMIRFWDVSTGDVKLAFRGWDDPQSTNNGGLMFVVDDIQISRERTVFQVSLRFDTPNLFTAGDWNLRLTDSLGRMYPLTNITPGDMDAGVTRVYETLPLPAGERLTLDLGGFPQQGQIPLMLDFLTDRGVFTFDPAPLQIGESVLLNQEVYTNGHLLYLKGAQKVSDHELVFEFATNGYLNGAMLYSPLAVSSSTEPVENDSFNTSISFAEMPNEPIDIEVTRIYYDAFGPWNLEFRVTNSMFTDMPAAASTSTPVEQAEPMMFSKEPLFLEVQGLSINFDESIIQDPGWIRVVSENITENIQQGHVYPPPYYQEEQWFEIDPEGWVIRNLTTHWDRENNILQQSVSSGTVSMNLTTGEALEFPMYRLSLDWILQDLNYALNHSQTVSREETTFEDDSPCLLITMSDGNIARRVWVNTETGQQVKLQTSQQFPDGTETILFTQTFLPVERRDAPPQEVLDVFSRVLLPAP